MWSTLWHLVHICCISLLLSGGVFWGRETPPTPKNGRKFKINFHLLLILYPLPRKFTQAYNISKPSDFIPLLRKFTQAYNILKPSISIPLLRKFTPGIQYFETPWFYTPFPASSHRHTIYQTPLILYLLIRKFTQAYNISKLPSYSVPDVN